MAISFVSIWSQIKVLKDKIKKQQHYFLSQMHRIKLLVVWLPREFTKCQQSQYFHM